MADKSVFDQSLALSIHQSSEPFPVNFDSAWQWLGYSNKASAKRQLARFKEGIDFSTQTLKNGQLGRSSDLIMLSIDCFKLLAMLAETPQGDLVRKYFLECERIAHTSIDNGEIMQLQQDEIAVDKYIDELNKEISQLEYKREGIKVKRARLYLQRHNSIIEEGERCKQITANATEGRSYLKSSKNTAVQSKLSDIVTKLVNEELPKQSESNRSNRYASEASKLVDTQITQDELTKQIKSRLGYEISKREMDEVITLMSNFGYAHERIGQVMGFVKQQTLKKEQ